MVEFDIDGVKKQNIAYLSESGIPWPYIHKSLKEYGQLGDKLHKAVTDTDGFNQKIKYKNIFCIYGDHRSNDILYSLARALLLLGHHGHIISYSSLLSEDFIDYSQYKEVKLLVIPGFFLTGYSDFPILDKKYLLQEFLTWFINSGKILLISSDEPCASFKTWFNVNFSSLILDRVQEYKYDSRG